MPFVPKNAPGFYSAMMHSFKEERDFIFSQMLHSINTFDNNTVPVTETENIYLNKTKLVSGRCTIIDDIFIFCSNLDVIIIYLECVCKVFLKYRVRSRIKNVTSSKIESNMSSMMSPKRGTAPLNQN